MDLYIDIGNTSTSLYFDQNQKIRKVNICTLKDENILHEFSRQLYNISLNKCLICCVVPEVLKIITNFLESKNINFKIIEKDDYLQFLNYEPYIVEQIGADRVIVDSASVFYYSNNVITIDVGTAITVDVIVDKNYVDGYIYPGIETSKTALINAASKLEDFNYQTLEKSNVLTTTQQINDGIIIGTLSAIKGIISYAKSKYEIEFKVIITGGLFNMIVELISLEKAKKILTHDFIYDRQLIIKGLKLF